MSTANTNCRSGHSRTTTRRRCSSARAEAVQPHFRADTSNARRRSRPVPAPGRAAARHRVGGGANQDIAGTGDRGAAAGPVPVARRHQTPRRRPPARAADGDRLELRPPLRRGAASVPMVRRLRRRCHHRCRPCRLRRRSARHRRPTRRQVAARRRHFREHRALPDARVAARRTRSTGSRRPESSTPLTPCTGCGAPSWPRKPSAGYAVPIRLPGWTVSTPSRTISRLRWSTPAPLTRSRRCDSSAP